MRGPSIPAIQIRSSAAKGLILSHILSVANIIWFLMKITWASPYTIIGLTIGCIGLCFGGRVQIRGRAIEFYDGGTKWFIHRLPHGQFTFALTLGHTILGQTDASLDISRKHEAVHVAQYERWGPFMLPAYFLSSIFVWQMGRRYYRDNPFEREAYDVDGGEHDK
ncbi:MAG: hypothetical protein ACI9G1_001658 [Pirellulaceae bacterium]